MRLPVLILLQFLCLCRLRSELDNLGFKTVEEGTVAQAASADIIMLCSSDEYAGTCSCCILKLSTENKSSICSRVPACTDDLKAIGIEHFINVKTNVLDNAFLKQFNQLLSI